MERKDFSFPLNPSELVVLGKLVERAASREATMDDSAELCVILNKMGVNYSRRGRCITLHPE